MFSVGDNIIYGNQGICKIAGIEDMTIDSNTRPYYVLKPVFENSSTIYFPVGNETAEKKMRRILSVEEVYTLIREMSDEDTIWIENESERKVFYRNILTGSDRSALVKLIKTLYLHEHELKNSGKKLHVSDEKFLKEAEKTLHDELIFVLDIEREEVLPFIKEQLEINTKRQEEDNRVV